MEGFDTKCKVPSYHVLMEKAEAAFKEGWHEADERELHGSRVVSGLERVFRLLGVELEDSRFSVVAPDYARCGEIEGSGNQCRHWINSEHEHEVAYKRWAGDAPLEPVAFRLGTHVVLPDGLVE